MTNEQKAYALKCLDTYAEIFGKRLLQAVMYHRKADACCALGALALFCTTPFNTTYEFGLKRNDITTENDHGSYSGWLRSEETNEDRFRRMRSWLENHPTTD